MQQGWGEWGSHQPYWSRVCSRVPRLCWALLSTLCGANPEGGIGLALVRAVFELSIPSGTSVQNMAHMAQVRRWCLCRARLGGDAAARHGMPSISRAPRACAGHPSKQHDTPACL
jgi:hypothetical protein